VITSSIFINCNATASGGSLQLDSVTADIKGCLFSNGTAKSGGGAISLVASYVIIESCEFTSLYAMKSGSAIEMRETSFVKVAESLLTYNGPPADHMTRGEEILGSGIACLHESTLQVYNLTAHHNKVRSKSTEFDTIDGGEGGVLFGQNCFFTIDGVIAHHNQAMFGAFVYASDGSHGDFAHLHIHNSEASRFGGKPFCPTRCNIRSMAYGCQIGVFVFIDSQFSIKRSLFENNTAVLGGSVFFVDSSIPGINASTIAPILSHSNIYRNNGDHGFGDNNVMVSSPALIVIHNDPTHYEQSSGVVIDPSLVVGVYDWFNNLYPWDGLLFQFESTKRFGGGSLTGTQAVANSAGLLTFPQLTLTGHPSIPETFKLKLDHQVIVL
jgi:hypothetical protein